MPIRLLAKKASGVSVAKRASLAIQPHDQNHQPGRAGAAAPPIIPIKRPAFDEKDLPVVNQPDRHRLNFPAPAGLFRAFQFRPPADNLRSCEFCQAFSLRARCISETISG
jgi:hypothetical protein